MARPSTSPANRTADATDEPDRGTAAGGAHGRAHGAEARELTTALTMSAAACARSSPAHGLAAKKSLGQNFLFDLNLTGKIARAAGPLEDGDHRSRSAPAPAD